MLEIKLKQEAYNDVQTILEAIAAASEDVVSLSTADFTYINTLDATQKFIEQHTLINNLSSLYFTLINKDSEDVNKIIDESFNLDEVIAASISAIAAAVSKVTSGEGN